MNTPRPAWSIRLTYDAEHDYVHAVFVNVVLHEDADVERWRHDISARLATFGRPVDLIIDLTGLVVRPRAAALFGRLRSQVLKQYALHSFRYGGDGDTRTSIFTSSVLHKADANVHTTREKAVAALLAQRESERPAERPGSGTYANERPGSGTHANERPGSGTHANERPGSGHHANERPGSGHHAERPGSGNHTPDRPPADRMVPTRPSTAHIPAVRPSSGRHVIERPDSDAAEPTPGTGTGSRKP